MLLFFIQVDIRIKQHDIAVNLNSNKTFLSQTVKQMI